MAEEPPPLFQHTNGNFLNENNVGTLFLVSPFPVCVCSSERFIGTTTTGIAKKSQASLNKESRNEQPALLVVAYYFVIFLPLAIQ